MENGSEAETTPTGCPALSVPAGGSGMSGGAGYSATISDGASGHGKGCQWAARAWRPASGLRFDVSLLPASLTSSLRRHRQLVGSTI